MHPEVQRETPGVCPKCGMVLVPEEKGYSKHEGHNARTFLRKFWISALLTIPVVLYSGILKEVAGFTAPEFTGSEYIPLFLGSIVFFYGGLVFMKGAVRELRAKLPGMMTLIGLAISVAYLYSVFVSVTGSGEALYWELTTLITVMLLGHWLEMRAVSGAQGALKELSKLLPDTAEVVRNGEKKQIPLSELLVGDIVFVRPGGRIPADGTVTEGKSNVNEAMITGESTPVRKTVGSEVIAGTINGEGSLSIKVTKIGTNTFLAGVMRLVEEAQVSKSRLQILSDRAALYLTVIAVTSGGATFAWWIVTGAGSAFALERFVAVLVIACPHALGLAVPLVASISTTLAARSGVLVKQRLALETGRDIQIVLFDKTGTLTKGEYGVTDIWPIAAKNEQELLRLAASVDAHSEHFISKAIVKKAAELNVKPGEAKDFERIPGKGVKALIEGVNIFVGGEAILGDFHLAIPEKLRAQIEAENGKGKTIIYTAKEKELLGIFGLADLIREESREAIQELKKMGVKVGMITGDNEKVAAWVATNLGIDEYFAKVLPEQKSEKVGLLQKKNLKVAMVGDGINDAPALTQADLGVAIGAGTNVAIESAGIILVKNDPRDIVKIISLSRRTYSKMLQNLFWATGYNVVALPLAAGVLASKGIILQPTLSAVFMAASTVIVAANAMLLRRKI
jgi:P-type Cu2+ transporter